MVNLRLGRSESSRRRPCEDQAEGGDDLNISIPQIDSGKAIEKLISFVVEQKPLDGKATAYVCQNYACNLPVTSPAELGKLLSETVAKQTITPSEVRHLST